MPLLKSALPLQAQIIYVRCVATLMATVMERDGSDTVPLLCREWVYELLY